MLPLQLFLLLNSFYVMFRMSANSGSFPRPLSAEDEKKCIDAAAAGDMEARNKLIEHNLRLVAHVIKKYYSIYRDQDDLISIGTIGLIKAVNNYHSGKGTRLATYAAKCIENEILMYFRSLRRMSSEVSLADPIDNDGDGNILELMDVISCEDTILEQMELRENMSRLLKYVEESLDEVERAIVCQRYGLGGRKPLTQREIAVLRGISRSYVSRIEKRAIKKLKVAFEK